MKLISKRSDHHKMRIFDNVLKKQVKYQNFILKMILIIDFKYFKNIIFKLFD